MSGALLRARGLVRRYAERAVVDDVSFTLEPGESAALVGPSGCGKTSLLQILGLLDRPDAGSLELGGREPWSLRERARDELRLRDIGFVFQDGNLLEHLSARDNVALPAWRLGGERRTALAAADRLLERFGLGERSYARAVELSTGEAQRVAVARALVNRPRLVLADEPTGSLDSVAAASVLRDLESLAAEGVSLLVATHDTAVAARLPVTLHMRDGKLKPETSPHIVTRA